MMWGNVVVFVGNAVSVGSKINFNKVSAVS
jgi:hypothetical protein